jgi:hypothetical protein
MDRLAFNVLPATFKKDMTAHQYDQQANQVVCKVSEDRVYVNNGPDANLYGLEPNFGCCTANFHQGWPKFAAHQWMASADGGLAAISYAPSTGVAVIQGRTVQFSVESEYPFRDTATIKVTTPVAMAFPLHLRIPSWAEGAEVSFRSQDPGQLVTVRTGDEVAASKAVEPAIVVREKIDQPGRFARFDVTWGAGTTIITVRVPANISIWKGMNDAAAINRGPLTFALNVPGEWKVARDRPEHAYDDWEVQPKGAWNYALVLDRDDPSKSITFEERPVGPRPFATEGAPIVAKVKGRKLPGWVMEKNAAAPPPRSPVTSDEPLETLTFLPYGCTDLRVTELPVLKPSDH